jgi:hypothetical protein
MHMRRVFRGVLGPGIVGVELGRAAVLGAEAGLVGGVESASRTNAIVPSAFGVDSRLPTQHTGVGPVAARWLLGGGEP